MTAARIEDSGRLTYGWLAAELSSRASHSSHLGLEGGAGLTTIEFIERISHKAIRVLRDLENGRRFIGRAHGFIPAFADFPTYVNRPLSVHDILYLSGRKGVVACHDLTRTIASSPILDMMRAIDDLVFQASAGMAMVATEKDYEALNEEDLEIGFAKLEERRRAGSFDVATELTVAPVRRGIVRIGVPRVDRYILRSHFIPDRWRRFEIPDVGGIWIGNLPADSEISYDITPSKKSADPRDATLLYCSSMRRVG